MKNHPEEFKDEWRKKNLAKKKKEVIDPLKRYLKDVLKKDDDKADSFEQTEHDLEL